MCRFWLEFDMTCEMLFFLIGLNIFSLKNSSRLFEMISSYLIGLEKKNFVIGYRDWALERFSIECRKTKTKPITYQLDYSANLKPK